MGVQWLSGRELDLLRHINPCLVLVQPRKTHPDISVKVLTGT